MEFVGWFSIFLFAPGVLAAGFAEDTLKFPSGAGALVGFLALCCWWFFLVYLIIQAVSLVSWL
jgi:hypothetical protein